MEKNRLPALVTAEGIIDPQTLGEIERDPKYGAPMVVGHMVVPFRSNMESALARALEESGELDTIGRSGHSRIGLNLRRREKEKVQFDGSQRVIVPIALSSLRAVDIRLNGVRDEFLGVFSDMVRERRREVGVGRLALASRNDALSRDDIFDAIGKSRLLLPSHVKPEEAVDEHGVLSLPLDNMRHLFCEENFDENAMRDVIRLGKHALSGLQEPVDGRPKQLTEHQFFVGGIRISMGPYTAIIDEETNTDGVIHLAARVLDGIRTTGIDVTRQVELFNSLLKTVSMENLKVRMRLYHATKEVQDFSKKVINQRTINHGVSFSEVVELEEHPERILRLMREISPTKADGGPYGYFIGPQKSHEIPWLPLAKFQSRYLNNVNAKVSASDPKYCVFGKSVPHFARGLSSVMPYVGREQNEGHVCATWAFPSPGDLQSMLRQGTGVFIAHDLRPRENAHTTEKPYLNENRMLLRADSAGNGMSKEMPPPNDVYFDGQLFSAFQRLHREERARFFLARHSSPDAFRKGTMMPQEVLEWDRRGFWIRANAKERIDRVDTLIAMYGSHATGMEDVLREQLIRFSLRLKTHFGERLGYIHGKGPGVMYIADEVAENLVAIAKEHPEYAERITENIPTIGVGIDAERIGQSPNFHPPAQVDFQAKDRLIRQKHMNDRATVSVFNIGGAGTLEEIALTFCSQKLLKSILAPMIFIDPKGLGKGGRHLWQSLSDLIHDLAEQKVITPEDAKVGQKNIVQLLQSHMANFIHIVHSYDEAADIIESFDRDPVHYYIHVAKIPRSEVVHAFDEAMATFGETGFAMPSSLRPDRIFNDPRWEAVSNGKLISGHAHEGTPELP
ncbi:MAG: LOG family protein [Candidatus Peregrinibacteria bacterium]|nr:LOG family protein [Candidatus Peregrinibacteria bacterium]